MCEWVCEKEKSPEVPMDREIESGTLAPNCTREWNVLFCATINKIAKSNGIRLLALHTVEVSHDYKRIRQWNNNCSCESTRMNERMRWKLFIDEKWPKAAEMNFKCVLHTLCAFMWALHVHGELNHCVRSISLANFVQFSHKTHFWAEKLIMKMGSQLHGEAEC